MSDGKRIVRPTMWHNAFDRKDFLKMAAGGTAAIAAAPFLAACGDDDSSSSTSGSKQLETLKVGLSPFQDYYVVLVAQKQGYWEEEGIEIEVVNVAFDAVTESLASGAFDIGTNNDASVLAAQEKFPEEVQSNIFFLFQGGAIMIRPDGPMKPYTDFIKEGLSPDDARTQTCAQLKGKTILLSINSDLEFTVAAAADQGNLVYEKDVKHVDGNPDDNLAAFLSGTGDGFIGGLPQRTRAAKEGNIPLITAKEIGSQATVQGGWAASETLMKEKPELFVKFQRATYRALQYIEQDREAGFQIIIDELSSVTGADYTQEDLSGIWNKLEYFPPTGADMEEKVFNTESESYWKPRYEFIQDFYLDRGVMKEPADFDRVFAFSWVQADYMKKYEPDVWKEMGEKHQSGDPVASNA